MLDLASHRLKCESQERLEKRKTEMEALASIITQLNVNTENLTVENLFSQLKAKIHNRLKNRPDILLKHSLNQDEWLMVDDYMKLMNDDFAKRSELLLKRLDVTIESFMWSDRIKKIEPEIMAIYKPGRERLEYSPKVYVEDVMAASSSRTKTKNPGPGAPSALSALDHPRMKIRRIEYVTSIPSDTTRRK